MKKYFAIITVLVSFIFTGCFMSPEIAKRSGDFFREGEGVSFLLDREDLTYSVGEEIVITYTTDISADVYDYVTIKMYLESNGAKDPAYNIIEGQGEKSNDNSYNWTIKSEELNSTEKKLILKVNEAKKYRMHFYLNAYAKDKNDYDMNYVSNFFIYVKDPSAEMTDGEE